MFYFNFAGLRFAIRKRERKRERERERGERAKAVEIKELN